MLQRAITGFFFVVLLIGATLLGPEVFVVFFSLIGIGCLYEFYGMVSKGTVKPQVLWGILTASVLGLLIGLHCVGMIPFAKVWLIVPMFSMMCIVSLFQKRERPFDDIAYTSLGIGYAFLPFLFFVALGFVQGSFNPYIPLGFLIILWSNDTGAYLAGRSFGKHKLFERISPNKTWEGLIGGVVFALLIAINLAQYFEGLTSGQWATMAVLIGIFGTFGDLVESMFKRSLGVKDSGHILPGHGGLMDRFDGLLLAAPLVFLFLLIWQ
ncbi:phosphatidate cytidylyltransferase [Sphingobacterium sp. SGG-5]|uniref:phosphatidate cytidylyltransferase n=1 Tax=Sphingobacterium sp. SGG-5 TaxID=2710881 RepID=UPI0013E9E940|nr:phosphatidate cytidylyltransferase [Sphingobacterium sp. SGG-5]NGM60994.1 phosphatidate cytidylyltransferase [Sphingobacterium sp. SGG-5]